MIIKVIIDTRRSNAEGRYPLKLSFANLGKTSMVSLNIYAFEYEFDTDNQILITTDKKTKSDFLKHNSYITKELSRASDLLHSLRIQNKDRILPTRFKDLFLKKSESDMLSFNSYFKEFITSKVGRTAEIYQNTLNRVEILFGKEIYFDDISYIWLEKLDKSMRQKGLKVNARSIEFRNIRAVINDAINKDIIGQELYPFRKFKIKTEKTRKRSISVEQIRNLFSYSGPEHLEWARDVAKLIFFLIGINVKDLYYLSGVNSDYIDYRRAKTHSLYSIKVEPETRVLLDKFKNDRGDLVFKDEMILKSFGIRINKHLKTIGKSIGVDNLTTYYLRHTWATIAAELDLPKETISAALGHSSNTTTDIYIDFNSKKIDDANRKVLNFILNEDSNNLKKVD